MSVEGQVRLCPPGRSSRRRGPRPGVATQGLDLTVHLRGVTTAVGRLRNDVLLVEQQSTPAISAPPLNSLGIPCPEPSGGWPAGGVPFDDRSPDDAAVNSFHARHPEMIGRLHLLHPQSDRQVLTVLVADAAEHQLTLAELGPAFDGRLCIIGASEDVRLARTAQDDERFRHGMMSAGVRLTDQWRQVADIEIWRITDAMIDALADYPPGLVQLRPFIQALP